MKRLSNFRLNRELSPEVQNNLLIDYIEEFYQNKNLKNLLVNLSSIFNIPEDKFDQDIKLFLVNNFKNSEGKFFPKFSLINSIISFVKNILIFFWILLTQNKKKNKKIFFDKIIYDISHKNEAYRFKNFLKYFKKNIIFSIIQLDQGFNFFLFNKYKNLNLQNSIHNKKIKSSFFYLKVFLISIRERTNYCEIIFNLIRTIIKYESIFSLIMGKYLIQERQFTTSKLKTIYLKKMVEVRQYCFKEILLN